MVEVGGPGALAQSIAAVRTAALMVRQARPRRLLVGSRENQLDMVRGLEAVRFRRRSIALYPLAAIAEAFRYRRESLRKDRAVDPG